MQRRPLMGVAACRDERDEELALFHDMYRKEDNRKSNAVVHPINYDNGDTERKPHFITQKAVLSSSTPQLHRSVSSPAVKMTPFSSNKTGDDLLTADMGKNDYDWLLTPPGTPLVNLEPLSSSYGEEFLSHAVLPNLVRSLAAIKTSRLSCSKPDPNMRKEVSNGAPLSMRPDPAMRSMRNGLYRATSGVGGGQSFMTSNATSMAASRRTPLAPTSRPTSRPTTPTKRSTSSSTPVSRPTTPTSRPKVAGPPASRPTTPTSRSRPAPAPVSRPSTPSSRPTIVSTSRTGDSSTVSSSAMARGSVSSRPTTPLRRPVAPQAQPQSVSAMATRSSSATKGRPVPSRSTPSSRGSSPVTKPTNAWQQLTDIPGFSLEPPPNLRTSLPTRPSSNTRGASVCAPRPGTPSMGTGMASTVRADLQPERSSEPSTRRPASPTLARGRSGTVFSSTAERQGSISTSTVRKDQMPGIVESSVRGGKVVERMVIMRRPFPSSLSPEMALSSSQIKHAVGPGTPTASKNSSGFGRSTPKKSTEATMRHMERHSSSNGLRSLVRNTPASSLYSVRPAGMRALATSSPMATSSNASSDYSCISLVREPESSEPGEEFISEAGSKASPASQSDSFSSLVKSAHTNNWLNSPEFKDTTPESVQECTPESRPAGMMQSMEKPEVSEPALMCRHGCVAANCDLCNMKIRLQKLNEKCRASLRASLQFSEEAQKGASGNGSL